MEAPDPFIQDPEHSQSYNRYTYVWNNPTNLTDPTGFVAMSDSIAIQNCAQSVGCQTDGQKITGTFGFDDSGSWVQTSGNEKPPSSSGENSAGAGSMGTKTPSLTIIQGEDVMGDQINGTGQEKCSTPGGCFMAGLSDVGGKIKSWWDDDHDKTGLLGLLDRLNGGKRLPSGGMNTVVAIASIRGGMVAGRALSSEVSGAKGVGEAYNVANGSKLAGQLTAESARSPFTKAGTLTQDAINGAKEIIAPGKLNNPAIPSGFGKYATDVFRSPAGDFTMHFYKNPTTGEAFYGLDYKAIFNSMSGR